MAGSNKYDIIGVGIGPFNLGMAALTEPLDDVQALFFEQHPSFEWHPGMLLEGTVLNSPFLADLVTFADPTSPYSIINYLHKKNRLYQFFFYKDLHIPRREYDAYGKWVAAQLDSLRFSCRVEDVREEEGCYQVSVRDTKTSDTYTYYARHVVVGTGSTPQLPPAVNPRAHDHVYHSSEYAMRKAALKHTDTITVVGSGQSAAEIFHDLLQDQKHYGYHLTWLTRSPEFFQSESAKLAREVFSPDYVSYFRTLDYETRLDALPELDKGRKGIEQKTLMNIYELLYHRAVEREDPRVTLQPMTEVTGMEKRDGRYELTCRQWQKEATFAHRTDKAVFATGYTPNVPQWIYDFGSQIKWEDDKRYQVSDTYRLVFHDDRRHHIYVLTNLDHSHGTAATNLALSVMRNQTIINDICGYEVYPVQQDTIFQRFYEES
ncbi:lysine N(6)-hydroxylase/L-ornithine N(5)-oxygenase family protein [Salibacterium halotolerans]|uniref:L-lysine N6-monooxygenase MbtG n=1 Tax=Salibacterium halotolerans TaxID=1884432 RepID=A0A1I5RHT5_9BACI|nr:SidA/IucD/PvdA family monooxygenase [Salibacterium halotolerans]SFP58075.1 lysine N6-hydroxylase [Salibacterium halotolerans]